jgi:hypothetical protein
MEKSVMVVAGTLVGTAGFAIHVYARHRFRAAGAPSVGPKLRPREWRTQREWFTSSDGYRLSQRGAWLMSVGALIALIGSFL